MRINLREKMNEFYYCVSLSILHPSVDPKWISGLLTGLRPKIEVKAGSEKLDKNGKPIIPPRRVPLSHWSADLHEEERLYSGNVPISDFILDRLTELEKYKDVFAELLKEGRIALMMGWFSDSSCSAETLEADTLKKCGDLGISIELHCYERDNHERAAFS
jgi:hypothetical protein